MPGIDHDAQQQGRDRVKGAGEQGDRRKLHTAAEGNSAHQGGPECTISIGLHQHTVCHTQHQEAGEYRDGQRKGRRSCLPQRAGS